MKAQFTIKKEDGMISINSPFSSKNNIQFRSVGGKFSSEGKKWVFNDSKAINVIIEELFGSSETLVTAKVHDFDASWGDDGVMIGGYKIVSNTGRHKPITYHGTAYLIEGEAPRATNKRQSRLFFEEGLESVFGLIVRKDFAERYDLNIIKVHEVVTDENALKNEKEKLLARINEIDSLMLSSQTALISE